MVWNDEDSGSYRNGMDHGRGTHGAAPNFSTTMLSDDGRFMGIKLSPGLSSSLNIVRGALADWISTKGEQFVIPIAEKVAKRFTKDEAKAFKIAGTAGSATAYALILAKEIGDVGANIYSTTDALNNLRVAVKPLAKAGSSVSPLSGDNEVVANARSKINGIFWTRLIGTATGSIAVLPTLMNRIGRQKQKNIQRDKDRELQLAEDDPKKLAEELRKELTLGSGTRTISSAEKLHAGVEQLVAEERVAYRERLGRHVATHKEKTSEAIQGAIDALDPNNLDHGVKILVGYGVDASYLRTRFNELKNRHGLPEAIEHIGTEIAEFKQTARQNLDYYAQEDLTKQFVRQNGAFDDEWTNYSPEYHGYNRKATISEQWETRVEKLIEQRQKSENEKHTKGHGEPTEMGKAAAGLASAAVGEVAFKFVGEKRLKRYSQPIAIDRILRLREVIGEAGDNPPDYLPDMDGDTNRGNGMSYAQFVHSIFQQHQKDSGRPAVGERFFEHFDNVRWEDAAIQQLPDEQLTNYEFAVKTIAKRIKDGRMDAIALINLVGDKRNKIVKDNGRTFGPNATNKDDVASREAILKVIDAQTELAHPGKTNSTDDVNEKLGNFVFSVEDIKKALETDALPKEERAFIFILLSDVVGNDKELCKKLGINDQRCQELRKEGQETFNNNLDAGVIEVAERIRNNDPDLIKTKISEKEKSVILTLAERITQDGKHAVDLTDNKQELQVLKTAVLNAALANNLNEKPRFLSRILGKAKEIPAVLAEAKKRGEEEAKAAPPPEAENFSESHAPRARARFADDSGPVPLAARAARDEEPVAPGVRR